jgi:flavin-dependent dehydrogenase
LFSSGVTIAMKSASLAAHVLEKQLRGEHVDWQREFADELNYGVETFRAFVAGLVRRQPAGRDLLPAPAGQDPPL